MGVLDKGAVSQVVCTSCNSVVLQEGEFLVCVAPGCFLEGDRIHKELRQIPLEEHDDSYPLRFREPEACGDDVLLNWISPLVVDPYPIIRELDFVPAPGF